MNSRRIRSAALFAGVVAAGVLLVYAARQVDLARVAAELARVRIAWVLLATACYLTILPQWAIQWRILAPRIAGNTFGHMLRIVAIASTAHNVTVAFVGEATSALLLSSIAGLSRAEAVSVIAMDQLLVGLAKVAVLAAAAFAVSLPDWMSAGIRTLIVGVAALLISTLLGAWRYEWIASRAERLLPARGARAVHAVGVALSPLRSPPRVGAALALAFLKKITELVAIVCVQRAFGMHLPPASAILVLAALNMATLVPVVPGNLGVYEAAVSFIYIRLGVPPEVAVGAALVQHAAQFVAFVLPGYVWASGRTLSARAAATE